MTLPRPEPLGGITEIMVGAVRTSVPVSVTVSVVKEDEGKAMTRAPGRVPSKGRSKIVVAVVIVSEPVYGITDVTRGGGTPARGTASTTTPGPVPVGWMTDITVGVVKAAVPVYATVEIS